MERITMQDFDKCPLLQEGFKIIGVVGKTIYISDGVSLAIIALLKCAKCRFKTNGCNPHANFIDLHEIEARIDQE